jgi:hypothetical protein
MTPCGAPPTARNSRAQRHGWRRRLARPGPDAVAAGGQELGQPADEGVLGDGGSSGCGKSAKASRKQIGERLVVGHDLGHERRVGAVERGAHRRRST